MTREIKFRAWSNEHNRYCDFVTLDENGRWIGWIKSSGVYLTTVDIVLEQDTGLKDKNGEAICEGDVVKATVRISAPYKGDTFRNICGRVIDGSGGAFCIEEPGVFTSNDEGTERKFTVINPLFNISSRVGAEVIGNIHENPELIEGEEND